jgi:protein ImuB
LRAHALAVQELKLRLELATVPPDGDAAFIRSDNKLSREFIRTLQLPVPMLDEKVFLKLLQLDLQAHPPGAPIVKIHLSAQPARPRALQSGLFQPLFPEAEKLELTLARIAGVVGEGRAGSVELLDSHREGAFEVRHFTPAEIAPAKTHAAQMANRTRKKNMPTPEKNTTKCAFRENAEESAQHKMSAVIALRLFRPPLAAYVTVREARPVQMQCPERNGIAGEIVWTAGPWRSSGDWSDQEGWSRDEWDIAVLTGAGLTLYRLVQDKLAGGWFLEGTYD